MFTWLCEVCLVVGCVYIVIVDGMYAMGVVVFIVVVGLCLQGCVVSV